MNESDSPTAQDLRYLEAFLGSRRLGPGVLRVNGIDGLVTAVVIGPDMVMPSRWMPRVWNNREPVFKDVDEARRIVDLIMHLYGRVAGQFTDEASEQFEPLYRRMDEGPDRATAIGQWCEGFMAGAARHATWMEKRHREATLELMWPMAAVTGGGKLATPEVIDQIVPNVRKLHAHWRR